MSILNNFRSVNLDIRAMEHILGGMDKNASPQAGIGNKVIGAIVSYCVTKVADKTVETVQSVDWQEHSKQIDERVSKNISDLCNDTKLSPRAW